MVWPRNSPSVFPSRHRAWRLWAGRHSAGRNAGAVVVQAKQIFQVAPHGLFERAGRSDLVEGERGAAAALWTHLGGRKRVSAGVGAERGPGLVWDHRSPYSPRPRCAGESRGKEEKCGQGKEQRSAFHGRPPENEIGFKLTSLQAPRLPSRPNKKCADLGNAGQNPCDGLCNPPRSKDGLCSPARQQRRLSGNGFSP